MSKMPPPLQAPPQQGWAHSPAEHAAASKLIEIEAHVRAIRNMMVFFVVFTLLCVPIGFVVTHN